MKDTTKTLVVLVLKFLQASFVSVTETCEHLGPHNAGKLNNSWICFLGGPEDDRLCRNMSP